MFFNELQKMAIRPFELKANKKSKAKQSKAKQNMKQKQSKTLTKQIPIEAKKYVLQHS